MYYWILREYQGDEWRAFREFVADFEDKRRTNRVRARRGEPTDPDVTEYNDLSRSINDAGSLEGRFRILSRRFHDYLVKKQMEPPLSLRLAEP